MRISVFLKAITLAIVFANYSSYAFGQEKALRFGSVAMDIPAVMHTRLIPLTEYLSQALKRPVILVLSPNMSDAIDNVVSGKVDIAYLTPVAYIRSREKADIRLIVKTITNSKPSFKLMIVVRKDSPIQNVEELAGKSFAFGDKAALLQRATVVGANMPLNKLGSYRFLHHYDNIVRAVLYRDFDAGILKDTKAYQWQDKGIRIIYESPELPPYNITASSQLPDDTYEKLKQAFLQLDINLPRHHSVITSLSKQYDGFAETSDSEYDVVRRLVKPFDTER